MEYNSGIFYSNDDNIFNNSIFAIGDIPEIIKLQIHLIN